MWIDWLEKSNKGTLTIGNLNFFLSDDTNGITKKHPDYFDFTGYGKVKGELEDNEEIEEFHKMTKMITNGASDAESNTPELAFLPIALNMSSGCVDSDGGLESEDFFFLRVGSRFLWMDSI
jgi:hypothetical protein